VKNSEILKNWQAHCGLFQEQRFGENIKDENKVILNVLNEIWCQILGTFNIYHYECLNIYFLVTNIIHAYHASRTYFFPHVLQTKAYFSVSERWLLRWALRFPLDTNPLRQCSHLNGRLSSGRWCIMCLSYVSSLASSFPHSRHLKSPNISLKGMA